MNAETFELSPDGRSRSLRTLEQAGEQAQAMLPSRPDVGQFRVHASTGLGRRLVGILAATANIGLRRRRARSFKFKGHRREI
jgi:hypothetical protein